MPRQTFSKTERAFIEAHKHDAEDSLRLLITDINKARREVASYALAFSGIADFLEEAQCIDDPKERAQKIAGVISVCQNFATPAREVYASLIKIENFDPDEHAAKKAGKGYVRRVLGDV